jgi:hypothetical protein
LRLGVDPSSGRKLELSVGSSVLLYADGLIERRCESLDDDLGRLTQAFGAVDGDEADEIA